MNTLPEKTREATPVAPFNPLVSFFANAYENLPTDIPADQFIASIKSNLHRARVEEIRERFNRALSRGVHYTRAKRVVDSLKKKLPGVTLAGVIPMRDKQAVPQFTGLLQADLDLLGERLEEIRATLRDDPHVHQLFKSATGEGLKAIYRVPICRTEADYKLAFVAVAKRVMDLTGVAIDELTDFTRLCFASWDPEACHNPLAFELPVDFTQPPEPPAPSAAQKPAASNLTAPVRGEARKSIAERLLRAVEWENDVLGRCACPGEASHTTGEKTNECLVYLDKVPTIYCVHKSCASAIEATNHRLRSEVGKAECGTGQGDSKTIADDELQAAYGKPVSVGKKGGVATINERYFAGYFHTPGNVIYEPTEKAFYSYDESTGIWRRESDDHIREAVSACVLDYGRRAKMVLDSKISVARMNGIVHALRAIAEQRDAFKQTRDFVHVQNGVIRFPGEGNVVLTQFQRADYSRNRSPVAFDETAECPQFYNDLLRAALPDDDIALLQCLMGLAVAGVNPAQRLVILDGNAATGKTQIARILQALVGAENCTQVRTALLNERFEIFRYIGKTLLLAPDVQGDFLNRAGASVLKALVGGDPLTAEAKGGNGGFDVDGNFNVLITANTRLRVRLDGDAGAWRRRLIILRFEGPSPARRIPNFAEKLIAEEGAGILRWALAGLLRAREQLTATGDLFLTPAQKERVEALLSESDSIRRFVAECTTRGAGNVSSHELVESYFHFCSTNEWTPQPVRIVERTLADVILEVHGQSRAQDIGRNGKSARGWRNVILNPEFARV